MILSIILFFALFSPQANAGNLIGPELNLAKFVDPLPIPPVVKLAEDVYPMVASQFAHPFHRDLRPSQIWSYNQTFPGPTLEVQEGKEARVLWINHLPNTPLLTIKGAMPSIQGLPPVRTVVHLHGASVPEIGYYDKQTNADGWPDAWNVPGGTQLAIYPNTQEASNLWYHDHTMGITSLNVYSGLAGVYLIRDKFEKSLKLPRDEFEIPLVLQSRSFNADGSLFYPPQFTAEFYGNTTTVNGKVWPYLKVEPRKYRFRMVNASNARSYAMALVAPNNEVGPVFHQIGSDGGFLEATVKVKHLTLGPGERADVIVDFSSFRGKKLILNNDSQTDDENLEPPIPDVMRFDVEENLSQADTSEVPVQMRKILRLPESEAKRSRNIVLRELSNPDGTEMLLMNGLRWDDPIVEKPVLNSTEIWNVVNATDDTHPFHIHLVQFQTLSRQNFDLEKYNKTGEIVLTGAPISPDENERGWKDTIRANPEQVTKIIMRFGPYYGRYVYHCHILEHEDMDMMRPFEVVPDESLTDPVVFRDWSNSLDQMMKFFTRFFQPWSV